MKFSATSLGLFACIASANAQYFSQGWKPGQPVYEVTDAPPAPTVVAQPEAPAADKPSKPSLSGLASLFDVSKILTSEPVAALFEKAGINITDRVAGVLESQKLWDERIPLITDDNFNEMIVEEPLTSQEEQDRTWIIVISVTAAKQDGISRYMDDVFDEAFNQTQLEGDLPNVRWGRIDYLNVTYLTTKWSVWQAPYLLVLRERGQNLRFYRPYQLRLRDDALRDFLKADDWKLTPPWTSIYGPGGDREYIMDFFAKWLTKMYNVAIMVPRWLMFVLSGSIASVVINFLHKPSKTDKPEAEPPASSTTAPSPAIAATTSSDAPSSPAAKRGSTRQRKTKK